MGKTPVEQPKVLVPYPGPAPEPESLDVFVYLRPESNGVAVESAILKVVEECRHQNSDVRLVYLANVPGSYIVANHIVERHYALRLFFAVHGGAAFSPAMRTQFEEFYRTPFSNEQVIGAFDALRRFQWEPEDLFGLWVSEDAVTRIAGQVVKRYQNWWIVNYDVPALLHKNNSGTDIAVMTFRTTEGYPHFFGLAAQMREALVERGLLKRGMPIARAVHISRSPFEQLIDARDYLLSPAGEPIGVEESSFARYLAAQGVSSAQILGLINHPVCRFAFGVGAHSEQNILDLCEGFSYEDARNILDRMESQSTLPGQALFTL